MATGSRRTIKQLIYGASYLIILTLIIYGAYSWVILSRPASCFDDRQNQAEVGVDCGGPCVPCGLENVVVLATTTPQLLSVDGNTTGAMVEVRNLNTDFGAEIFDYDLNFYNAGGEELSSISGISFIYPSEVKLIVEPIVNLPIGQIVKSEVVISNITWATAADFIKPALQTRDIQTKASSGGAVVSGLAINNNSYPIPEIRVAAVVADALGNNLGVSKTLLRDVVPGEQRFFSIDIPLGSVSDLDPGATSIYIEAKR
ncbi:MAG: hypothetical protein Q8O87_04040 [bacterium]|nr:hypothetical protein [bacterium]